MNDITKIFNFKMKNKITNIKNINDLEDTNLYTQKELWQYK